ncbi:hypothetical protein Agabi119p4_8021 [Agaricus bisporus var. burnettii]|uniref:Uncharacterized protein n=1 Tax=Agaricus bisporus var. burnettii TaxID=192524 RepID=A0A8H7EYL5_AGABI|nr:hypothetical protein Agabi119p4_8021 [Agaricus bisporus var. burnettii]
MTPNDILRLMCATKIKKKAKKVSSWVTILQRVTDGAIVSAKIMSQNPAQNRSTSLSQRMKAGTRVYYWTPSGEIIYGTVQSSTFLSDNTEFLTVREDAGRVCTMPVVGLYEVGEDDSLRRTRAL